MSYQEKKRPLLQLCKKEIFTQRIEFLVIFAFNILWPLFVMLGPKWLNSNKNDTVAVSVGLPTAVVFFWGIWVSFKSISYEWEHNTSYLLLSLPISGMKVLAGKIVSILTMLTIYIVEVAGMGFLVNQLVSHNKLTSHNLTGKTVFFIASDTLLGFIYLLAIAAILIILCQFAFILSRLVNRFSKVFAAIAACVSVWLFFRGTVFLTFLINFLHLPHIKLLIAEDPLYCNPSPLIATLLLAIGFLFATARLFDHVIEV